MPVVPPALNTRLSRTLAIVQGGYFVVTGLWPFVHMRSFLWVTGPKTDLWLVETVSATILAIGAAVLASALHRRITPEVALLAVLAACGLGAVETWYALHGRIRWVYLGDAALELAFLALWAVAFLRSRRGRHSPGI